jgi:hypothetical protein
MKSRSRGHIWTLDPAGKGAVGRSEALRNRMVEHSVGESTTAQKMQLFDGDFPVIDFFRGG